MVKRIGTHRRKTRHIMKKPEKERGKFSLKRFFQKFKEGEAVVLKTDSAYQKGFFHPRFHGKHGIITGIQGKCYTVEIIDGNKKKEVIAHPIHLRKV